MIREMICVLFLQSLYLCQTQIQRNQSITQGSFFEKFRESLRNAPNHMDYNLWDFRADRTHEK